MTVNHGVLGSSPCSGAIARGLQKRFFNDSTTVQRVNRVSVDSNFIEAEESAVPSHFSEREFSSAGLEHLPYKQRVGGSNPSTPTKQDHSIRVVFSFVLVDEFVQSVAVWQSHLHGGAIAVCAKSLRDIDTIVEL